MHHMNGHMVNYEFDKKEDVFEGNHVVSDVDGSTIETYQQLLLRMMMALFQP